MSNRRWKIFIGTLFSIITVLTVIFLLKQDTSYQAKGLKEEQSFSENLDQLINEEHFVGNVLVIKNNTVFFDNSYGFANKEQGIKNEKDTLFPIASLQKMITGAIILKFVEEHKLTLTTSLADYYPNIPLSQEITVQDLLNHTSGLVMDEIEPDTILRTEESQIENVLSELNVTRSKEFIYTNANYTLLAGIISQISGMTYEKTVEEKILKPLNMTQTYFWDRLPEENRIPKPYIYITKDYQTDRFPSTEKLFSSLLGAGNLYMTTEDMWKFIHGLTDGQLFEKGVYQTLANAKAGGYQAGISYSDDFQFSEGLLGGYNTLIYGNRNGEDLVILFGNQSPVNGMTALGSEIYQLLEEK